MPAKGRNKLYGLDRKEGDAHQLSTLKGYVQHFFCKFCRVCGLLGFGIVEFEVGTGVADNQDEFASADLDVGYALGF